jgi:hypothetical protein
VGLGGEREIKRERERERITGSAEAASHPQSESAGVLVLKIAEPLGCDEGHDADDGIAYGEYAPEDADGLGVPDVVGRVHVRRLDVLDFRAHCRWRSSSARVFPSAALERQPPLSSFVCCTCDASEYFYDLSTIFLRSFYKRADVPARAEDLSIRVYQRETRRVSSTGRTTTPTPTPTPTPTATTAHRSIRTARSDRR